ncbi:MAG: type IV pilus assembly protein FimV [Thiobacillus sp.]
MNLKPFFLLLGLSHAASVAALGLGELNVRSNLGQPLHATVVLLGTSAETTAACFSIEASGDGIAPPPRAQLSIQQAGGQTLLHIRTLQSVNDPIAQFVLVSDCETRLRRDYVMLLDPPAQVTSVVIPDAPAAAPHAAAAPIAAAPAPRPRAHRKTKRARVAASSLPVARTSQSAAAPSRPQQAAPAPRLVLSGKHGAPRVADAPIALRLDTRLPELAHPRPSLTATELSDENTALTRRLAHLEAQLAALKQRNAELDARRTMAPTVITPPPERPAQWPLYLLAIGMLGGGIALVAWLPRRRRSARSGLAAGTPGTPPDPMMMTLSDITAGSSVESFPLPQRMPEIAAPPRSEDTEVKEDILDQAEVFMAHGHGELAVHLLQEHLREAPTESPVPWLLLLDLLHRAGNIEGYAAASAECRRYFNVNLTGHPISQDNEIGQGLEAYPHLLEELVSVWNTPDIHTFFHDLIYDDRGGTRMGFEPGAYRDILMLREIAREALPLAA